MLNYYSVITMENQFTNQLQDFIYNLRNVMDTLDANVNSPSQDSVSIEELATQMKQFKEELLNSNKFNTNEDFRQECCNLNRSGSKQTSHLLLLPNDNNQDINRCSCQESAYLRRDNKNLKQENARLKNENSVYQKKLKEEAQSRQSMQRELSQYSKLLESNKSSCSTGSHDTNSDARLHEKVKEYQKKEYTGRKEREELRFCNIELERQLKDAKKTIQSHEKKLLLYSQVFNNPSGINFSHNLKPCSSSLPPSPSSITNDMYYPQKKSLYNRYYDSQDCNHNTINDQLIRKCNSSDSISTASTQSFEWHFVDMDVIPKGRIIKKSRSEDPNIYSNYKSS